MKHLLVALMLWMALVTASLAQYRAVDVVFTHHVAEAAPAYRAGDECFLPLDALRKWGYRVTERADVALVAPDAGAAFELPSRAVQGVRCVPARALAERIGAEGVWSVDQNRFEITSPLDRIAVGDRVDATGPLPVSVSAFVLSSPMRLVVDLTGARLTDRTRLELPVGARASQFRSNVVRIVREVSFVPELPPAGSPAATVAIPIRPAPSVEAGAPEPPAVAPDPPTTPPANPPVEVAAVASLPLTSLTLDIESPTATLLTLRQRGVKGIRFRKPTPDSIEIVLPQTLVQLPPDFKLGTARVTGVTALNDGLDTFIRIQLARPMGAEVWADGNGLTVQLLPPPVGDGRLNGKVVVVDPGHGAQDSGAHRAGVSEKTIVLAVSRLLSQELARQGATVVMTRKSDVFIPLVERSALATRNGADFFISIHANSSRNDNTSSGTMTFHHKGRPLGRLLAECIQAEITKVSGLPDLGVRSDGSVYDSGFSVLRNSSSIPGVLVELGFVNHRRDRARMVTADFQQRAASAMARGIRVYLGSKTNE